MGNWNDLSFYNWTQINQDDTDMNLARGIISTRFTRLAGFFHILLPAISVAFYEESSVCPARRVNALRKTNAADLSGVIKKRNLYTFK